MSERALRVLFVCTGNICRSPTALAVFRAMAEDFGVAERFAADAAGLRDCHTGRPPDPRALAVAARRGYDLSELRARPVEAGDFEHADRIVGMGSWHVEQLAARAGENAAARIESLLDFAPEIELDEVPDPYRGAEVDFERSLTLIESGCLGLLRALCDSEATALLARSGESA